MIEDVLEQLFDEFGLGDLFGGFPFFRVVPDILRPVRQHRDILALYLPKALIYIKRIKSWIRLELALCLAEVDATEEGLCMQQHSFVSIFFVKAPGGGPH